MKPSDLAQLERAIDREVRMRFGPGAVRRVILLQGDDAGGLVAPGEILVRVQVEAPGGAGMPSEVLAAWAQVHRDGMRRLRRELSLRLPMSALLEFAIDGDTAAIAMPHDPALPSEPLSASQVVHTIAGVLRARYVYPDRAEQAAAAIEASLAAGEYEGLAEEDLAEHMTEQMFQVCADKHLRVRVEGPGRPRPAGPDAEPDHQPWHQRGKLDNYGIVRVERLEGNVGYLELRRIPEPANAGQAIAAVMELVSGTEALIIDLRRNGGGSPDGVIFWCSYLFDGGHVHLNDIVVTESAETKQYWSLAYVPGTRFVDRPVYVLSSGKTFSGGEDFCYTLQAQGRTKVIGEVTGGGAHPTARELITERLALVVPFARSVNPVTGTNWEGTGVVPDIAVTADQAFDVAYSMALEHVLGTKGPEPLKEEARAALAALGPPASAAPGSTQLE